MFNTITRLTSPISSITRKMHIEAIPMRWGKGDNYCYLVVDNPSNHAWIIDPAEPKDIEVYLAEQKPKFELKAIVNTHHHYDHSDGNKYFHHKHPDLPVIAGKDSPLVSYTPSHKEIIDLGDNLSITALHTPCHTQDSICYYIKDQKTGEEAVFTGDTLFTSGCGRFFEGTGSEMDKALNSILGTLPPTTKVYPGHEYTRSNVKFSKSVLNNQALDQLEKYANSHEFTTGIFTIGDELEFNPFMKLTDPQITKVTGTTVPLEVMTKLRELKNSF